eukprot:4928157-Pleurochrysis_carterae.AAC.4
MFAWATIEESGTGFKSRVSSPTHKMHNRNSLYARPVDDLCFYAFEPVLSDLWQSAPFAMANFAHIKPVSNGVVAAVSGASFQSNHPAASVKGSSSWRSVWAIAPAEEARKGRRRCTEMGARHSICRNLSGGKIKLIARNSPDST